jgi:hypothetical protein
MTLLYSNPKKSAFFNLHFRFFSALCCCCCCPLLLLLLLLLLLHDNITY